MTKKYQRYSREILIDVIKHSSSFSEACRKLQKKPVGGVITNMKLMCDKWNIDYSHMSGQGWKRGKPDNKRKLPEEFLIMGKPTDHRIAASRLRKQLFDIGFEYKCVSCGISEWNNKPLTLEIDHIDECYWNNTKENLQFLCPNCHSQKNK